MNDIINYNMNFLVAAFLVLLLIGYHSVLSRKLYDYNSRIFSWFVILGILDVGFDLITTVLLSDKKPDFTRITMLFLTIFYLLQILVPYALFMYTWALCMRTTRAEKILGRILVLPAVLMGIVVLSNVRLGILFRIDGTGTYIRGPLYFCMYLYAYVYGIVTLACSIWSFQKIGIKKFCIILEFLLILGSCVGVQAVHNELLMTGFGLMLGILVLYLTISNPSDYIDSLTGLLNSRSFRSRAQQFYDYKKEFHVMIMEVPQIRQINMLFGSKVGDSIFGSISDELDYIAGPENSFRLSGKRFAVICSSLHDYENTQRTITDFLNRPQRAGKEEITVSGIVCGISDGLEFENCDMLVSYMDYLVSLAPSSMENVFLQGDQHTKKGFLDRKEIESYLYTAIEEDLFELYFQPVFSLEKNAFVTLEALSRLYHPTLGPVSPDIFIGIAEKNGQIRQIGKLQFRRLCRFIKEHPALLEKLENVKFNLSPAEILQEGCSQELLRTIQEFGLPHSFFQFEVTETVATEYSDRMYQIVEEFQRYGIGLCLDDFGSGYANLDTVLKLSFSCIKLDRSLLNGITEDNRAGIFYRNIVAVLKNMGYDIVAEGVETKNEMEFLRFCGVDMIQGYYFSKPLPPEELLDLLL